MTTSAENSSTTSNKNKNKDNNTNKGKSSSSSCKLELNQEASSNNHNYEHLSKKTRIELVGATNDHNYNAKLAPIGEGGGGAGNNNVDSSQQLATACDEQLDAEAGNGQMDDCMAAMVLMFLSCRPGGQLSEETLKELQRQNGCANGIKLSQLQKLQEEAQQQQQQRQNKSQETILTKCKCFLFNFSPLIHD